MMPTYLEVSCWLRNSFAKRTDVLSNQRTPAKWAGGTIRGPDIWLRNLLHHDTGNATKNQVSQVSKAVVLICAD